MEVKRPLRAADFNLASLVLFTQGHCDNCHHLMKKMLREWCLANGFAAAVRLNQDPDEVVIVRPAGDLNVVDAQPL
jgi:hypothetical protein